MLKKTKYAIFGRISKTIYSMKGRTDTVNPAGPPSLCASTFSVKILAAPLPFKCFWLSEHGDGVCQSSFWYAGHGSS